MSHDLAELMEPAAPTSLSLFAIVQHAAEPRTAATAPAWSRRDISDQPVLESLVIALVMIVKDELSDGPVADVRGRAPNGFR